MSFSEFNEPPTVAGPSVERATVQRVSERGMRVVCLC